MIIICCISSSVNASINLFSAKELKCAVGFSISLRIASRTTYILIGKSQGVSQSPRNI